LSKSLNIRQISWKRWYFYFITYTIW